jgi:hypothetical protein
MILTDIRKTLGASRRALRVRLFGNNQALSINLRNRRYHTKAQRVWAGSRPAQPAGAEAAERLASEGYAVFAPASAEPLFESLKARAEEAFAVPEFCTRPIDGAIRLKDSIARLPQICEVITPQIVQAVEAYFRSFFKIYWVQVYRTVPSERMPEASFLWHVDNCPPQVVKLMAYLTDTYEDTGAFRLKPRPLSRELIRRGFWDRSRNERFASQLEEPSTTTVFEGPKGTRILFLNWGCVHRAKHPERSHRDVAVFNFVPSMVPWDEHMRAHKAELSLREDDVCPDPARY